MTDRRVKPCSKCGHPKNHHRTYECRHVWRKTGQTFMGNRMVTHWCVCNGYVPKDLAQRGMS